MPTDHRVLAGTPGTSIESDRRSGNWSNTAPETSINFDLSGIPVRTMPAANTLKAASNLSGLTQPGVIAELERSFASATRSTLSAQHKRSKRKSSHSAPLSQDDSETDSDVDSSSNSSSSPSPGEKRRRKKRAKIRCRLSRARKSSHRHAHPSGIADGENQQQSVLPPGFYPARSDTGCYSND